jgi:hypothetical protein
VYKIYSINDYSISPNSVKELTEQVQDSFRTPVLGHQKISLLYVSLTTSNIDLEWKDGKDFPSKWTPKAGRTNYTYNQ